MKITEEKEVVLSPEEFEEMANFVEQTYSEEATSEGQTELFALGRRDFCCQYFIGDIHDRTNTKYWCNLRFYYPWQAKASCTLRVLRTFGGAPGSTALVSGGKCEGLDPDEGWVNQT